MSLIDFDVGTTLGVLVPSTSELVATSSANTLVARSDNI